MKNLTANAQMAMDTILQKPTNGIPTGLIHFMEHSVIERLAQTAPGSYKKDPNSVYIRMLNNIGVNMVDQYLAENPLSMGDHGYEKGSYSATTGCDVILDTIVIDSPEAVIQHIEEVQFIRFEQAINDFDEQKRMQDIIDNEHKIQGMLGEEILKTGHGAMSFPALEYFRYGYENFFMAYALYPEVFEKYFKLQADLSVLANKTLCKAYLHADLPLFHRLDHDIADSRGILVGMKSLEKIWISEFARSIKPAVDAGLKLLWHCDGNLMEIVPYLIEAGVNGFQGFQYEDGMDYIKICRMKTKNGDSLVINAGVSVTRTLPFGNPDDIRRELKFLVDNGPKTGLFLGTSSTCTPGTPWDNIETLVEGFKYYRKYGRDG